MGSIIIVVVCIIIAVAIPTLIAVIGIVHVKYTEEHMYKCTKCSHEFDIQENGLNSFGLFLKLYVKCPKCGKYSAVEIIRKKS
jgi:DNA-directed RNA polymerase subunit RPC12/RpoP